MIVRVGIRKYYMNPPHSEFTPSEAVDKFLNELTISMEKVNSYKFKEIYMVSNEMTACLK